MAPPAAQAQLLLSSHPSPSPPHHRRLLPLLLRRQPPRPHTCTIRHYQGHDKCASSSPRLRHALRPPAAAAAVAIAPGDHWGNWAFLLSAAAFGTWAEENTSWGAALSGALVSIMAGLAATAVGLVTPGAVAPRRRPSRCCSSAPTSAAVPLLLLGADLRRVVRTTGDLLKAFLLGSVATVIGTTVAYLLIPMRSLGQDSWKIAAALMGSYIGGGKCKCFAYSHPSLAHCALMTSSTATSSGELRCHLGGSGPHAVRPRRRRRSGQPHLGALLHGALLTGNKHPSRAQDGDGESDEGRRARRGRRGPAVRAERRRRGRSVVHHLQGRVSHGRAAGPPGRHAAMRHGAGGVPGHGVPGPARQARAGRRVPGAHPYAALLRRRRGQRQRRGRRHPGAQRLRLRACAGVRPPRRRARGRQDHGDRQEAAAHRLQRQRRRAHHGGCHGHGQGLDLARRARNPRRHLRDLHCHVSWHRIWHVRAQKNLQLNST